MANNNLNFREIQTTYTHLAINEIVNVYGDSVVIKPKSLFKFGRNDSIDIATPETVQFQGGTETYATSNSIDRISSSSTSDTTQTVLIEGHTISGSDLTFVTQTATLNGQNKANLTTPLYRCSRLYNTSANNFVGNIYVYEDTAISTGVPTDATKIHLKVDPSKNQSEKASTSFSSVDYGIITSVYGGVTSKRAAVAEFNLQIREYGKVFRTILNWSSAQGETRVALEPHVVVPPNSDIRITAKVSVNDTEVVAGFNAYFALIN